MNRRILDARLLVPGDRIEVGGYRFVVDAGGCGSGWVAVVTLSVPSIRTALSRRWVEQAGKVLETAEEMRRKWR